MPGRTLKTTTSAESRIWLKFVMHTISRKTWQFVPLLKITGEIAVWFALMQLALMLGGLQTPWSSALCGPWGCGATLESLVAYHLFWVAVFSWPVWLLRQHANPSVHAQMRKLALGLLFGMVLASMAYTLLVWLPGARSERQAYVLQRVGYDLVRNVDVPLAGLLLVSVVPPLRAANRTAASPPTPDKLTSV